MIETRNEQTEILGASLPYVLIVECDFEYGLALARALRSLSVRAKYTRTVDEFLDLNCRERIDLVWVEVNSGEPETLDTIKLLRTHFGEGPGTNIVAASSFIPVAFSVLAEQCGADMCITKHHEPKAMARTLEAEIRRQMKSRKNNWAGGPGFNV